MDVALEIYFYFGISCVIAYAGKQVWDSIKQGEWHE